MNLKVSMIRASNYLDERHYPVHHHLFHAVLFSLILIVAAMSSVESSRIAIFGHVIPPLCMFKGITGLDCPGCGITRSFVYAVNGEWYHSYFMHIWGIPLAAFLAIQIPYRIWRASGAGPIVFRKTLTRWIRIFILISILLPWIVKTTISLSSLAAFSLPLS